jgi:hypothetical protein
MKFWVELQCIEHCERASGSLGHTTEQTSKLFDTSLGGAEQVSSEADSLDFDFHRGGESTSLGLRASAYNAHGHAADEKSGDDRHEAKDDTTGCHPAAACCHCTASEPGQNRVLSGGAAQR